MADMFLKIEGVTGESQDEKHAGELEVHSFSWGVNNSGSFGSGSMGGGTGKASVSNFNFMCNMDSAFDTLTTMCASGEHPPTAEFVQRKQAGTDQMEFSKWTLTKVIVTSVQVSSGGDVPMVSLSLDYGKVQHHYEKQGDDGSPTPAGDFTWDQEMHTAKG